MVLIHDARWLVCITAAMTPAMLGGEQRKINGYGDLGMQGAQPICVHRAMCGRSGYARFTQLQCVHELDTSLSTHIC